MARTARRTRSSSPDLSSVRLSRDEAHEKLLNCAHPRGGARKDPLVPLSVRHAGNRRASDAQGTPT